MKQLSSEDFKNFEAWFDTVRADKWDEGIKADVKDGKLNKLSEQALSEFKKGKFTKF